MVVVKDLCFNHKVDYIDLIDDIYLACLRLTSLNGLEVVWSLEFGNQAGKVEGLLDF